MCNDPFNLLSCENQLRNQGFNLDRLYSDIDEVWSQSVSLTNRFNDTQKKLLCLNLAGNSIATTAGKLSLDTKTCRKYASQGYYQAFISIYEQRQTPACDRRWVGWDKIGLICEDLGYYNLENSINQSTESQQQLLEEFINYVRSHDIDLLEESNIDNIISRFLDFLNPPNN